MAVKLVEDEARVGLAFDDVKRGKPYFVDFTTVSWRTRFVKGLPRNHIFRRALGVAGEPLKVVDATCGFGGDAVMALCLGCEVTAIERSEMVARVFRDGVERAIREDEVLRGRLQKLKIVIADSAQWLSSVKDRPDVVYLDPMFDKPKKKAKSSKEMQLLQELVGGAGGEDQLMEAALRAARLRVVVKRPLKARALMASPAHSFKGQSIRYDVYLVSGK